jgi:hypothetical protein
MTVGFDEWTCMDGPKRHTSHFMKLLDGEVLCFDIDSHMQAYYRADVEHHELWLVRFAPRGSVPGIDGSDDSKS